MTKFIYWNRPSTARPQGAQSLLGAAGTAVQVVAGAAPEGRTEGDYLCKSKNSALVSCIPELHYLNILNKDFRPGKAFPPNQLASFGFGVCFM